MTLLHRAGYRTVRALCAVLLSCAAFTAAAQDTEEIDRLIRQGQLDAASSRIEALLARDAKDPRIRFLKGIVLSEQGKLADAIAVFQSLTEDYPELPEPYNNLATLFAAGGQFEKAITSLEMAIQINPSYGTAHENIGDVYARMATRAYDKALQLDRTNTNARAKLTSISSALSTTSKPATTQLSAPPPTGDVQTPKQQPTVAPAAETAAVLEAVNAWANAWTTRNLEGFLSAYSKNFAPEGRSRAEWEAVHRSDFRAAKALQINIEQPKVDLIDGNQARVTFRQRYRSERASLNSKKYLLLAKEDGIWHIAQERVLP